MFRRGSPTVRAVRIPRSTRSTVDFKEGATIQHCRTAKQLTVPDGDGFGKYSGKVDWEMRSDLTEMVVYAHMCERSKWMRMIPFKSQFPVAQPV
jgi:hypothetical protein